MFLNNKGNVCLFVCQNSKLAQCLKVPVRKPAKLSLMPKVLTGGGKNRLQKTVLFLFLSDNDLNVKWQERKGGKGEGRGGMKNSACMLLVRKFFLSSCYRR